MTPFHIVKMTNRSHPWKLGGGNADSPAPGVWQELGVSYTFISHDLSTVRTIRDWVVSLYAGQMVETGGRDAMRGQPMHPYTDLLISSVPELRTGWLDGISPTHLKEAAGAAIAMTTQPCSFFSRCAQRAKGVCNTQLTLLRRLPKGADIRCQRSEEDWFRAASTAGEAPPSAWQHAHFP